jgi:DNA-binding LytR/AlgR family response regulator
MSEESTTLDLEELAALFRAALPDGTDVAHIAHDDDVWAAYSQAAAALYTPDFVYEDSVMPDLLARHIAASMSTDGPWRPSRNPSRR